MPKNIITADVIARPKPGRAVHYYLETPDYRAVIIDDGGVYAHVWPATEEWTPWDEPYDVVNLFNYEGGERVSDRDAAEAILAYMHDRLDEYPNDDVRIGYPL